MHSHQVAGQYPAYTCQETLLCRSQLDHFCLQKLTTKRWVSLLAVHLQMQVLSQELSPGQARQLPLMRQHLASMRQHLAGGKPSRESSPEVLLVSFSACMQVPIKLFFVSCLCATCSSTGGSLSLVYCVRWSLELGVALIAALFCGPPSRILLQQTCLVGAAGLCV